LLEDIVFIKLTLGRCVWETAENYLKLPRSVRSFASGKVRSHFFIL